MGRGGLGPKGEERAKVRSSMCSGLGKRHEIWGLGLGKRFYVLQADLYPFASSIRTLHVLVQSEEYNISFDCRKMSYSLSLARLRHGNRVGGSQWISSSHRGCILNLIASFQFI